MSDASRIPVPLAVGFALAALVPWASSCAEPSGSATVRLALRAVPDSVQTIGVSIRDVESQSLVASTTTAVPITAFTFGVPAERPLEFLVVASTNRPGPAAIGVMPAYVGRVIHEVPLGARQEIVGITVHRAGVLTLLPVIEPADLPRVTGFMLSPVSSAGEPIDWPLDRGLNRASPSALILRTGRWDAKAIANETRGEDRGVTTGRGLYVAPETESVARLVVGRVSLSPRPGDPVAIRVTRLDDPRATAVRLEGGAPVALHLGFEAVDGAGVPVASRVGSTTVMLVSMPAATVDGATLFALASLPAELDAARVAASGRLLVRAVAELEDGRKIKGELTLNVLAGDEQAGPPMAIALSLDEPARLSEGTELVVDVLDGRGRWAFLPTGTFDFSSSDPFAFYPSGPILEVTRGASRFRREVVRASGPRGLSVVVRTTLTSTWTQGGVEASLSLPVLDLESP